MDAKELFKAGKLTEAIAAATEDVKRQPDGFVAARFPLRVAVFCRRLSRADAQLDALGHQDPQLTLGISMFRQLIRAEQARQQFYAEGRRSRVPRTAVAALECNAWKPRSASAKAASARRSSCSTRRKACGRSSRGVCNGQAFGDLRDVDDLTAPFFEVLTSNGKYYWIPIERVELIEFRPPERPRDLFGGEPTWSFAAVPTARSSARALPGSAADPDERFRMGRMTDGAAATVRRSAASANGCSSLATRAAASWNFNRSDASGSTVAMNTPDGICVRRNRYGNLLISRWYLRCSTA